MIRIGLVSPSIGNGKLGDEATVAVVIQNIRRPCPITRADRKADADLECRAREGSR